MLALCENICPTKAIKMKDGYCGYRYPIVSKDKCIDCNLCNVKCPINLKKVSNNFMKCYAAHIKDKNELEKCASGGIATSLAKKVIKEEGVVFGVSFSDNFKETSHIKIDRVEDLYLIQGSKYTQSNKDNIYKEVELEVNKGKMVLFVGLPCEIAAIDSLMPKGKRRKLILCELVCHGPTSKKTLQQFVEFLEQKYKSKMSSLNMRFKKEGWEHPYLKAEFENGDVYIEKLYSTKYGQAFYLLARESCYQCRFKIDNSKADITLGDFWGLPDNNEIYDKNGVSICICHTERGVQMLFSLKDILKEEVELVDAIKDNEDVVNPRKLNAARIKFSKLFNKHSLSQSLLLTKVNIAIMDKINSIFRRKS